MTTAWEMWTDAAHAFAISARRSDVPMTRIPTNEQLHSSVRDQYGWVVTVAYRWAPGAEPLRKTVTISENGDLANISHTAGFAILGDVTPMSPWASLDVTRMEEETFSASLHAYVQAHSRSS